MVVRIARFCAILGLGGLVVMSSACRSSEKWTFKKEPKTPPPPTEMAMAQEQPLLSKDEEDPPSAKMYTDFGYVRASMKQYAGAADLFERAIRTDPKYVEGYLGLAKMKMAMGHPDQAVEAIEDGLKRHPKAACLWNELGVAYAKVQNYPAAVEAMEKACKLDPEEDLYPTNLAGVLAVTGKVDAAYRLYSHQMSAGDAHCQIARIVGGQGNRDLCQRHIELALKAEPQNPTANSLRAQLSQPPVQPVGYQSPTQK